MRGCLLLLTFGFILAAAPAYAGAWTAPQGQGLFIGNATYYTTDHYFDTSSSKQSQPRFSKVEFQPYVEYGVQNWLTLGGSAYAQAVEQSDKSNYGLADPEIFARTRVWHDDKQVVSLQPLLKFGSDFDHDNPPRGGSKSVDAELSVLYGRNLQLTSNRDYVDVRTGYRVRSDGLGDEFRGDVALGLGVTDNIQIIPALRTVVAVNPTTTPTFTESGDLDYSEVKAEVTGIYNLDTKRWVQATVFSDVAGMQTGDGGGFSLGFAQRF